MSRFKCQYFKNQYCFICARHINDVMDRCKLTDSVFRNFNYCFQTDLKIADYTPSTVCKECRSMISNGKQRDGKTKFKKPAEWRKPNEDHKNCYLCLHKLYGKAFGRSSTTKPVLDRTNKGTKRKYRKKATTNELYLDEQETNSNDETYYLDNDDIEMENEMVSNKRIKEDIKALNLPFINQDFLISPKLTNQKSLDEFAINLTYIQKGNKFLIFHYDPKRPYIDDCKVILKRMPICTNEKDEEIFDCQQLLDNEVQIQFSFQDETTDEIENEDFQAKGGNDLQKNQYSNEDEETKSNYQSDNDQLIIDQNKISKKQIGFDNSDYLIKILQENQIDLREFGNQTLRIQLVDPQLNVANVFKLENQANDLNNIQAINQLKADQLDNTKNYPNDKEISDNEEDLNILVSNNVITPVKEIDAKIENTLNPLIESEEVKSITSVRNDEVFSDQQVIVKIS